MGKYSILNWAILMLLVGNLILLSYNKKDVPSTNEDVISIHKYNELDARHTYTKIQLHVANIMFNKTYEGADTIFEPYLKYHLSFRHDTTYQSYEYKLEMMHELKDAYHDYCKSITFMFMDEEHDSTWVYNSDTYGIYLELCELDSIAFNKLSF